MTKENRKLYYTVKCCLAYSHCIYRCAVALWWAQLALCHIWWRDSFYHESSWLICSCNAINKSVLAEMYISTLPVCEHWYHILDSIYWWSSSGSSSPTVMQLCPLITTIIPIMQTTQKMMDAYVFPHTYSLISSKFPLFMSFTEFCSLMFLLLSRPKGLVETRLNTVLQILLIRFVSFTSSSSRGCWPLMNDLQWYAAMSNALYCPYCSLLTALSMVVCRRMTAVRMWALRLIRPTPGRRSRAVNWPRCWQTISNLPMRSTTPSKE